MVSDPKRCEPKSRHDVHDTGLLFKKEQFNSWVDNELSGSLDITEKYLDIGSGEFRV